MKNKHMTLSERIDIEKGLSNGDSIRKIARDMNRPHTTILTEIKLRKITVRGNTFNLIPGSNNNCEKLLTSPYVCNSCIEKRKCRKNKCFYYASESQNDYRHTLVDSRTGIDMQCDEFNNLCAIVKKEVKEQSNSFYMIKTNHDDEIKVSVRTLYRYQEKEYLPSKNIDLPRKVRYKLRVKRNRSELQNPNYRINRTYNDFKIYLKVNNISYYYQMDTVEGVKGKAVLLTFIFLPFRFFLAFKLDSQTIKCVNEKIDYLKQTLDLAIFYKMFPIGLTDNGKEFKDPEYIEYTNNEQCSRLFYCNPGRSDQKGSLEVLHEYPRRYIEKGQDISMYKDEDILKMVNHINSVPRKELGDETAYDLMARYIGRHRL